MSESIRRKHILLATPPLIGHAVPLLQLGGKLSRHHRVTFAVSRSIVERFRDSLKEYDDRMGESSVRVVEVPERPSAYQPGEPRGGPSALRDIFNRTFPDMREFFASLRPNSSRTAIKNERFTHPSGVEDNDLFVDAVIVDNFLGGPASVLRQAGIPYYLFNTARVALTHVFLSLNMDVPENYAKRDSPFAHAAGGGKMYDVHKEGNKDILMENHETIPWASGIIFNSLRAAEENSLREIAGLPGAESLKMFFVAPLCSQDLASQSEKPIIHWLDDKPRGSVVYFALGSIAVPSAAQTAEIAKGLLLSKAPFIWSLPTAQHSHLPADIQRTIQEQNSQECPDPATPFLILPWVPQTAVLKHPSTGVFVSHCGWNSTLETLSCGVPVVGWPMFADQMLNAEWLETEAAGRLIPGTGETMESRLVAAEELANVVREVAGASSDDAVVGAGTPGYREGALKWQVKIREALADNGSSTQDFLKLARFE
ncbi:putative Crocetin glucosyltransferase, chloroplastic [Hypsibius exemplaris]|uniref:UDP-glucuronosyltransferase n=1 Tax=Hypsibius exemplaris TaxID=2072580 RepID=A0A1W0WIV4_HYPEX|nr:putative Crocetin glucosyltransferase, chloroplastic [Hypsibius exemplaris]